MATINALQNLKSDISITSRFEELVISPSKTKNAPEDVLGKDIQDLIDASKKKLSSLDSQRILGVVDDIIIKIEIVTLVPYISENVDRYSVMLGSNICNLIKEYDLGQHLFTKSLKQLRRLGEFVQRPASTGSEINNNRQNQTETEHAKVVHRENQSYLEDTVKSLIRSFRLNPAALASIRNETHERSSEANSLLQYTKLLKDQTFARLVTTPHEERDKKRATVQVMMREKRALGLIKKLEAELETVTEEKDNAIKEKNETIRNLKSSIQMLEQGSDLVNRKIISDAQKIESADIKNSESRKAALQQELINLKQKYQSQVIQHRDSELSLRKRKYKIETEVENWIQNYDNDMAERQDEIDELSVIYAEEKKQLEELETRFNILAEEYNTIIEERRIATEKRLAQEKELRNMVKAATLLQSFWRAYKCRKALKAKQKKQKKGKGKGGKKKQR